MSNNNNNESTVTVLSILDFVKTNGLEVLADADADREHWLEMRKTVLTASDIASVIGVQPGMSRIWYRRKGWLEEPQHGGSEEAMQMGHDSEEFNASLFCRKTGRQVQRCQLLLRNPDYPWLGVTPDYLEYLPESPAAGVLELKSTGQKHNWPEDDEPALKWQAQLQAQMLVLKCNWGSLSAIIGSPFIHHRWVDFEAHEGMQDVILERTQTFMESLSGDAPPWDEQSHDHAQALHRITLQVLSGETVRLGADALEYTMRLEAVDQLLGHFEQERGELRDKLQLLLGTSIHGVLPDGQEWSFKTQSRAGYTVAPSQSRVLRKKGKRRHEFVAREFSENLAREAIVRLLEVQALGAPIDD